MTLHDIAASGPQLHSESAIFASGQCTHRFIRRGYTATGKPRRFCVGCAKYLTIGGKWTRMTADQRAMQLVGYYRRGLSMRETARITGLCQGTVGAAFRRLRAVLDLVASAEV